MSIFHTKWGSFSTADFAAAERELIVQGILVTTPEGPTGLKIPREEALRLLADKTTSFPKAAMLGWILSARSNPQNQADHEATEKAVTEITHSIYRIEEAEEDESGFAHGNENSPVFFLPDRLTLETRLKIQVVLFKQVRQTLDCDRSWLVV